VVTQSGDPFFKEFKPMADQHNFTIQIAQENDFQFRVTFDGPDMPALLLDEPAPLGRNAGPNAARLVAAAVANCLSASLLFSMRKFKQDAAQLTATATTRIARNDKGRFRIAGIDVAIQLDAEASKAEHLDRSLAQFEDFCIVTQSIRQGVPVNVSVVDAKGQAVHRG
jgi:uncharacterized OsmC-like protein